MDPAVCMRCMIHVSDTDRGIECDVCCRWFHASCVSMSASEYKRFADDQTKKWLCGRVDCKQGGASHDVSVLEKILNKIDTLATRSDLKTLSEDISALRAEVTNISSTMAEALPRISKMEVEVKTLKNEINDLKSSSASAPISEVYSEFVDRTSRQSNVILYKIPESTSSSVMDKKTHDQDLLAKIFVSIGFTVPSFTFHRLGKSNSSSPRPVKVIFSNPAYVNDFFKSFSQERIAEVDTLLSQVTSSRDRTPGERTYLKKLRSELDERLKRGEKGLTIKFMKGIPKIVNQSKN